MTSEAKAFAPANISCIFRVYGHKNPRWMGSYGAGFTLNEGVVASASKSSKTGVYFNNKKIDLPSVEKTIKKLTDKKIKIKIKAKLPLGCGFGLSGASALAAAYAANELLNLKKTRKELAIIAHTAEVESKTGLGDVINQLYGGFCVKLKPSSYFIVKKLPIKNKEVYCRYFGKIPTKSIITNRNLIKNINNSAEISMNKIQGLMRQNKKIRFKEIIGISREFAVSSGLLKDEKTMKTIKEIEKNNGNASMIMLGNAVFSDKPFKGAIKLKIMDKGAHIL